MHKNNKIKLWCNIIFSIDVEQIKNNRYFILFFEDVAAQKKFMKVYVYQPRNFLNKLFNYKSFKN
jgi:hypothetical protein